MLLVVQLASTLLMTGIIWFVQVVHYPLFLRVAPGSFQAYEAAHATRTGWVVGPLMVIELVTACLMLVGRLRPHDLPLAQAIAGAALVLVIWSSTAFVQVPLHHRLSDGYDAGAIATLIATNWIRTAAWTARAGWLLYWTARSIDSRHL